MAGIGFLEMAQLDLRFALRAFRRTPGFTAVAVLTLAVGIGANTAIFSAVNAVLLRPLPFRDPARLMKVSLTVPPRNDRPGSDDMVWSYPKFAAFRDAQGVFEDLALVTEDQRTLRGGSEAERAFGEVAGARYLTTLGIQVARGRNFLPEEDRHASGPRVVILGDALWQRRFNADPAALGQALDLGGQPYTIVGVAPTGFRGLSGRADFWVPIMSEPVDEIEQAWSHSYTLIARLKAGVSSERAKAVVRDLGIRVDRTFPDRFGRDAKWGAIARELDATRVDPLVRRSLLVLLAAVGLVLLIACANVANLFLVRATARRREIAVRLAVGAGRGRLVRQLLTESLVLSSVGGAASVAVAWLGVKLLASLDPASALHVQRLEGIGAVTFAAIRLDGTTFAFAAVLAVATGLLFGLVPALQATRPSLSETLKDAGARSRPGGIRGVSTWTVLAALEIALALVLLAGSGLMLRSLGKLLGVNPGFDAEHVLTMRFNTPEAFARDSLPGFYDQLLQRLAAIPGVTAAALGDCPPLNGGCAGTVIFFRDRPPVSSGTEPDVGIHWISPAWPGALRVKLQRGRLFTDADRIGTRKVVLVSEMAARTFWPGQDPLERPVSVGQGGFHRDTAYVIGVLSDVRFGTLDSVPKPDVFLSFYQSPRGRMMLFVRTTGNPLAIAAAARRALHEMAPDLPVYDMRTMESRVADAMSYARFSTLLLALFGAVALALATMGAYGVMAFAVRQRTREIGIRMALGATYGKIARQVVGEGLWIAAIGGATGLVGALAATRVMRSLLYDVVPSDPTTFAAIIALLLLAVIAASWIPARRAARTLPTEALREG